MHLADYGRADARAPLMLAVTIAGGTLTYADPVRFDNDGSFEWTDGVVLDVTRPVAKQTGFPGAATFRYERRYSSCCPHETPVVVGSLTTAQLEGGLAVSVRGQSALVPDDFAGIYGQTWRQGQLLGYYYADGAGFYTQFDDKKPFGVPGDPGYIAARIELDGATHYGWMSLTLTHYVGAVNWVFDLVAWGYETEPNTPIEAGAVPAPSAAMALLAFGAAGGATRARRG